MEEKNNAGKFLVEKPVGKIASWRTRRTWEDNIKMDLTRKRTGGCAREISGSGQGVVVDSCEHSKNPRVP
jgi:hypothetical protein